MTISDNRNTSLNDPATAPHVSWWYRPYVSRQWTVCELSIVNCELRVVNPQLCEPSALWVVNSVSCRQWTASREPSTLWAVRHASRELWAVDSELWTASREPSALWAVRPVSRELCELSTVNCESWTLNSVSRPPCESWTLSRRQWTVNCESWTLSSVSRPPYESCMLPARRWAYHGDVAKLVGARHRVVVEHAGAGEPARRRVVGEDDQLVLSAPVAHKVEALLDVGHHDPVRLRVDRDDEVGNVLQHPAQCEG